MLPTVSNITTCTHSTPFLSVFALVSVEGQTVAAEQKFERWIHLHRPSQDHRFSVILLRRHLHTEYNRQLHIILRVSYETSHAHCWSSLPHSRDRPIPQEVWKQKAPHVQRTYVQPQTFRADPTPYSPPRQIRRKERTAVLSEPLKIRSMRTKRPL